MTPISITILTKNSEKHLHRVLSSLEGFDEVIVYDTGSTDSTISIARSFPYVTVYEGSFVGFGRTHNEASSLAKNRWVLSIDSDEVVGPDLKKEILSLALDENCVYSVRRKNFYRGKEILGCGWGRDIQKKLYNKEKTSFSENSVHEEILSKGLIVETLKEPLEHFPFDSIAELLHKMNLYTSLYAEERRGKPSSIGKALCHGFFAFIRSYLIWGGFRDGYRGFVISLYNSQSTLWKYLKLYELSCDMPPSKGTNDSHK